MHFHKQIITNLLHDGGISKSTHKAFLALYIFAKKHFSLIENSLTVLGFTQENGLSCAYTLQLWISHINS